MTENSTKINAILIESLHKTMESHPLISTIVTLYTLIFLYFPIIAASPVIISTSVLLLSLLRLGVAQKISQDQIEKKKKPEPENPSLQVPLDFAHHDDCTNFENDPVFDPDPEPVLDPVPIGFHDECFVKSNVDSNCEKDSVLDPEPQPETRPFYVDSFVEWNVRAQLEVIYEAYEGEEEEYTEEKRDEELRVIERYASLSMYYPETDTDSSSGGDSPVIGDWDSPENLCFRWDEEDREELIEIELDCKRNNSEVEEENLIEIDLSPPYFTAR
ncbi:hypothetical protein K7X08_018176 [Anisodus acutangulus]|uniref:Transmembrane protein n=1 Tax=Anisodus acutangulus TaxID=402998 RepID=A0A9Q1R8N6_9SOLA|nr:hypothetical protein K7X08_018176 [Anisodus acutangulus]